MSPVSKERNVREDLLHAAGTLFAEYGFSGTGVREIIRLAGATLSSVNYYFGSKENLYLETIRYVMTEKIRFQQIFQEFLECEKPSKKELSSKLYSLIQTMFYAFHQPNQDQWHGRFLARVMLESQKDAVDLLLEIGHPVIDHFEQRIQALLHLEEKTSKFIIISIFSQIQYLTISKTLIMKSMDMTEYTESFIQSSIRHIARNVILPLGLPEPACDIHPKDNT